MLHGVGSYVSPVAVDMNAMQLLVIGVPWVMNIHLRRGAAHSDYQRRKELDA